MKGNSLTPREKSRAALETMNRLGQFHVEPPVPSSHHNPSLCDPAQTVGVDVSSPAR
jgi:hypothetical protein